MGSTLNGEKSSVGNILGPLLFVIYINDLLDVVEASMLLFADDPKLYRQINPDIHQFQPKEYINNMNDWSKRWLVKFHPGKCRV